MRQVRLRKRSIRIFAWGFEVRLKPDTTYNSRPGNGGGVSGLLPSYSGNPATYSALGAAFLSDC